uniref:Meiotic recombination protein REC8-like protein n=1 Tax=Parastrongyloides trichosuri TaxID=131310 RepID=A0A0N4ZMH6_PARTI
MDVRIGEQFDLLWFAGHPRKKKFTIREKKRLVGYYCNELFSNLEMFIVRQRIRSVEIISFRIPEYKFFRLIYGATKVLSLYFEEQLKSIRKCTDIVLCLSTEKEEEKREEPKTREISAFLFNDDKEIVENISSVKRKRKSVSRQPFDESSVSEFPCGDINFSNMSEVTIVPPYYSPELPKKGRTSMLMERKRIEIPEIIDIIREASREYEGIAELTREAFSINQTLSMLGDTNISLNGKDLCNRIFEDESAELGLYLHKILLVEKKLINDEFIKKVEEKLGKHFSVKADTKVPSDVYEKFRLIKEGKKTFNASNYPNNLINDGSFQMHAESGITDLSHVDEPISEDIIVQMSNGNQHINLAHADEPVINNITAQPEASSLPRGESIYRSSRSSPHLITTMETPQQALQVNRKQKASSRCRKAKKPKTDVFEFFEQKESILEKEKYCKNIKSNVKESTLIKLDATREAYEKMFHELCGLDHLYNHNVWFNTPQRIFKNMRVNNGILRQILCDFEKLFLNNIGGSILDEDNNKDLFNLLSFLNEYFKSNEYFGIYALISDCNSFGLLSSHSTNTLLKSWIEEIKKILPQVSPNNSKINFYGEITNFPKFFFNSFLQRDPTISLRTLPQDFKNVTCTSSKVACRFRKKYNLKRHIISKESNTNERTDSGDDSANQNLIEKIFKDIIVSDNTFHRKIFSFEQSNRKKNIQYEIIRGYHKYNCDGVLVWSDAMKFIEFVFSTHCLNCNNDVSNILNEIHDNDDSSELYSNQILDGDVGCRIYEVFNVLLYNSAKIKQSQLYFSKIENGIDIGCLMFPFSRIRFIDTFDNKSTFQFFDEQDLTILPFELTNETHHLCDISTNIFSNAILSLNDMQNDSSTVIRMPLFNNSLLLPIHWKNLFDKKKRNGIKRFFPDEERTHELSKRSKLDSKHLLDPQCDPTLDDENLLQDINDISQSFENTEIAQTVEGSVIFKSFERLINNEQPLHESSTGSFYVTHIDIEPITRHNHSNDLVRNWLTNVNTDIIEETNIDDIPMENSNFEIQEPIKDIEDKKRMELTDLMSRKIIQSYVAIEFISTPIFKNKYFLTEKEIMACAAKHAGTSDLNEDGPSQPLPDEIIPIPKFTTIKLVVSPESSDETLRKVKKVAGSKMETTFKKLVMNYKKKFLISKSFTNLLLISREKGGVNLKQIKNKDIKIKIIN